jgi:hypothetical protein
METPVTHKSFRQAATAEDRRVMQKWTYGVLIVYGAFAVILLGVASLSQHSPGGSKEPTAAAVTAAKASRNQSR